jgi:hypothetical protein
MGWFDLWTILMAALVLLQIVLVVAAGRKSDHREQES